MSEEDREELTRIYKEQTDECSYRGPVIHKLYESDDGDIKNLLVDASVYMNYFSRELDNIMSILNLHPLSVPPLAQTRADLYSDWLTINVDGRVHTYDATMIDKKSITLNRAKKIEFIWEGRVVILVEKKSSHLALIKGHLSDKEDSILSNVIIICTEGMPDTSIRFLLSCLFHGHMRSGLPLPVVFIFTDCDRAGHLIYKIIAHGSVHTPFSNLCCAIPNVHRIGLFHYDYKGRNKKFAKLGLYTCYYFRNNILKNEDAEYLRKWNKIDQSGEKTAFTSAVLSGDELYTLVKQRIQKIMSEQYSEGIDQVVEIIESNQTVEANILYTTKNETEDEINQVLEIIESNQTVEAHVQHVETEDGKMLSKLTTWIIRNKHAILIPDKMVTIDFDSLINSVTELPYGLLSNIQLLKEDMYSFTPGVWLTDAAITYILRQIIDKYKDQVKVNVFSIFFKSKI